MQDIQYMMTKEKYSIKNLFLSLRYEQHTDMLRPHNTARISQKRGNHRSVFSYLETNGN